jgi:hypothetical protein
MNAIKIRPTGGACAQLSIPGVDQTVSYQLDSFTNGAVIVLCVDQTTLVRGCE